MQSPASGIAVALFKTRNFLFFVCVLTMHLIILRPTPADGGFMVALFLSVILNPTINVRVLVFFMLTVTWTVCVFLSSLHLTNNPDVQFLLFSHVFVWFLALAACLTAITWHEDDFLFFMKMYIAACCCAAFLGMIGFIGGVELFAWDGRAKALFPEPNVLGAFLLPGVLGSIYLLKRGQGWVLPFATLGICAVGVLLSFSRVAIFSMTVVSPIYFVVLSRGHRSKAIAQVLIAAAVVAALLTIAVMSFSSFETKVFDRSTVAKEYDVGPKGRYTRYLLSIPIILDNPGGIGLLEVEKYFPEPIHNLFIGSFLDYGWVAGVLMILLTGLGFKVAFENERATHSPISMWIGFCLLSQIPCAMLQQVEHWRHLWMFLGLLWGFNIRNFPAVAPRMEQMQWAVSPQLRLQQPQ